MVDLSKKTGENEEQYIWRICQYKDNGVIDIGWDELGYVFNSELRDEDTEQTSSAWRKPYQNAKRYYENVFSDMISGDKNTSVQEQLDEIYRAKRQLSDQRREYNKLLMPEARGQHLAEHMLECAKNLNKERPLLFKKNTSYDYSNRDAVLVLSDWHYGMCTDNIWNKYNVEICKSRVETLTEKVLQHIALHKPARLHILILGDMANGGIHNSSRVASEEDVSDQLMHVAEMLAQVVDALSPEVGETFIYSTYGNHMRTIQNIKDSIHTDNMEKIIPWWLRQRLSDKTDVHVIDSEFKEFIKLNVCGYNVIACHGDLDRIKNFGQMANTIFTKLYGETIDYAILGDKHHHESMESFGIETMISRSLCGSDNYANSKRLYSDAGQTLMLFSNEDGKECTYNIKLS